MGVVFALLAAFANALSSVLQRRAAMQEPGEETFSLKLIGALLRRRGWYLGILALILGFLLQALALSRSTLALVEPLLIAELPLTILIAAATLARDTHIPHGAWMAIAAVTIGLSALMLSAAPSGGNAEHVPVFHWTLFAIAAGGAICLLVLAASRVRGDARAALLGAAAGSGFGISAALIKSATEALHEGAGALFSSWQLYAMVLVGLTSLALFNNAVHSGRLVAVQPAVTLSDPIVSVLIGVTLFHEHVRTGLLLLPELCGVGLIVIGTMGLAKSAQMLDTPLPAPPAGRAYAVE